MAFYEENCCDVLASGSGLLTHVYKLITDYRPSSRVLWDLSMSFLEHIGSSVKLELDDISEAKHPVNRCGGQLHGIPSVLRAKLFVLYSELDPNTLIGVVERAPVSAGLTLVPISPGAPWSPLINYVSQASHPWRIARCLPISNPPVPSTRC
ncbi:unnamed protein product [Cyclocybe aegerita]|uniref:Uncharacterized protein n=1 Tax=Cyclocybe aegerita TaxID=1973307 RepID=A0A8S0VXU0_CYCAE|nr:unnamed protein product [Cyclocybe aegerita]